MAHFVVKKKHLRYIFYVSILFSMSLFKQGMNNTAELEEGAVTIEANTQTEGFYNRSTPSTNFDNQNDSKSNYYDVAINSNPGSAKRSSFSSDFISREPQNRVNSVAEEAHSLAQASQATSDGMQIYEEERESPPNNDKSRSRPSFSKNKAFASVGGAFGGGASTLADENPPGGPGDPIETPLDGEAYLILILGILIGFFSLRKKKVAV